MPDAYSAIWNIAVEAYSACEGDEDGEPLGAALGALFAPENRDALIAEAVNRGVLVAAGAIEPCTEEFRAGALAEDIDGETLYRVGTDVPR